MDGLLLTRRQRLRSYGEKMGLVVAPSLVLALVVLALGLWIDAVFVAAFAAITAISLGSSVGTRRGAAIVGVLLAASIIVFLYIAAWLISHPIQRGD